MRIYRSQDLVGILVAPGDELVTDDEELRACLGALVDQQEHSVPEVLRHLNAAGFTARGAYQMAEGPTQRERESQFFHTQPHHAVGIKITTIADSKPPSEVKTDDATIQQLRQELTILLEQRGALQEERERREAALRQKLSAAEAERDSLQAELRKVRDTEVPPALSEVAEPELRAEPQPENKSLWRKLWEG